MVAIDPGAACSGHTGVVQLTPGTLAATLTLTGLPLGDLSGGTQLGVGREVILELTGPGGRAVGAEGGGLRETPTGARVGARIVTGGSIRVGDPVRVEAVALPIEDALDLHVFRPEDVRGLVEAYLDEARAAGFQEVRIIHGRGQGVLRATVRRLLADLPGVAAFGDAPPERGGWGATVVRLRPGSDRRPP